MEFRAEARYMRVSPQKARLVLDLIKGRRVEDALNTLVFTKKRVAATIEKLLRSALENANYLSTEKNLDVDVDSLYVKSAVANDGPRMKRIRPAPMGRAFRYVRRIAHIEISLAERSRGSESVATVAGEERTGGRSSGKAKARTAKNKPKGPAGKSKQEARHRNKKKFAGSSK
jgi:large subunit ribosomal protein L22